MDSSLNNSNEAVDRKMEEERKAEGGEQSSEAEQKTNKCPKLKPIYRFLLLLAVITGVMVGV